jgi:hypothetical protein
MHTYENNINNNIRNINIRNINSNIRMEIIKKINKIIKKKGIKKYTEKWNPLTIPDKFKNNEEYEQFIIDYIGSYHKHAFPIFLDKNISTKDDNLRPMPKLSYDKKTKIATLIYYKFVIDYNDLKKSNEDQKKLVLYVKQFLSKCYDSGLNGIIIDLRKHTGGSFYPFAESLQLLFEGKTLFAFHDENNDYWLTMEKGMIKGNNKIIPTKDLKINIPIAIIIGNKTSSSGEFSALCFIGHNNVKTFGDTTAGFLSANSSLELIKKKLMIVIPMCLAKSVDGKFYDDEIINPQVYTKYPLKDAIDWIKKY